MNGQQPKRRPLPHEGVADGQSSLGPAPHELLPSGRSSRPPHQKVLEEVRQAFARNEQSFPPSPERSDGEL